MVEKENPHKNHRKRLKSKVKKFGLECLEYHEILELLLTYTIARKDTNPLAHELLQHFNSFSNVIDADYHDLLKVNGIGPESASFFNILSQFIEVYNKSKLDSKTYILNNTDQSIMFFRDTYRIKNNEFMVVACLGKTKKVIKTYMTKGKDETQINFDLKKIINSINDVNVDSVVLFHTHPKGSVEPSREDIITTQKFFNICLTNGIKLNDHIILNESEHYSFKREGLIDNMLIKYNTMFLDVENCSINKKQKISKNDSE